MLAAAPVHAIDRRNRAPSLSAVTDLISASSLPDTAVFVQDLVTGKTLHELNSELPLKPASVMKLATTHAALQRLGADFTWRTQVALHGVASGKVKNLSVRGSGDPSLTIESLWLLARRIYKAGVRSVDSVILDDSAFSGVRERSGARAYEGGSSALAFNFNSLGFEVCPTSPGKDALISSDPWEMAVSLSGQVKTTLRQGDPVSIEDRSSCDDRGCRMAFELGGTIALDSPCVLIFRSVDNLREYFGRVLTGFLRELGIKGDMQLRFQRAPAEVDVAIPHSSRPLHEVLTGLNNFSTNVTAEQIVYALGCNDSGEGCSHTQGVSRIRQALLALGARPEQVQIVDGSGLSHENRLSARVIAKILEEQYKNQNQGIEFQSSLSVWGRSGTLKKRQPLPGQVYVRGKTGSLDGVSSLAGYLYRPGRNPLAFVVLQNRVASKAKAVDIEDAVIELISRADQG